MGGGLMQLVAYGAQDIYLTGNPQITFFKVVYRRHTNFSMEAIEQVFNGTQTWGAQISATISRNGDLVHKMYYEYSPLHMFKGFVKHQNSAMFITPKLGNTLLKEVEVEIGGQRIDRHYSHWLSVWSDLTEENKTGASAIPNTDGAVGGAQGLSQDVSTQLEVHAGLLGNAGTATMKQIDSFNHRGFMLADNASRAVEQVSYVPKSPLLYNWRGGGDVQEGRQVQHFKTIKGAKSYDDPYRGSFDNSVEPSLPDASFVPLQFWFCRNPGLALPLIALQYHEVKVKITLCDQDSIVAGAFAAGYGKIKDKDDVTNLEASKTSKSRLDPAVGPDSVNPYRSLLFNRRYSSNIRLSDRTKQTPNAALGTYHQGKLWADYIYLDTDERRRFAQVSHEYLIEQLQFQHFASGDSETADLNFNHPVKELIWTGVPILNSQVNSISQHPDGRARVCPRYSPGHVISNNSDYNDEQINDFVSKIAGAGALERRQALEELSAADDHFKDMEQHLKYFIPYYNNFLKNGHSGAFTDIHGNVVSYSVPDVLKGIMHLEAGKHAMPHITTGNINYTENPGLYSSWFSDVTDDVEEKITAQTLTLGDLHTFQDIWGYWTDLYTQYAEAAAILLEKERAVRDLKHDLFEAVEELNKWEPVQCSSQRFFLTDKTSGDDAHLNPYITRVDSRITNLEISLDRCSSSGSAVPGSLAQSPLISLDLSDAPNSSEISQDKGLYDAAISLTPHQDAEYQVTDMDGVLYKVDPDGHETDEICVTMTDVKENLIANPPGGSKLDAFVTSRNRVKDPFITQVPKQETRSGNAETWCLKLNGHERFAPRPTTYFTRTQINQHHTGYGGIIQPDSIGVYSFALKPEEHQPSGTCNFSRIDNAQLVHPKMPAVPPCWSLVSGRSAGLNVYAINYNVLRIMSGMGGLAYSN